jgi:hypothetical protein
MDGLSATRLICEIVGVGDPVIVAVTILSAERNCAPYPRPRRQLVTMMARSHTTLAGKFFVGFQSPG